MPGAQFQAILGALGHIAFVWNSADKGAAISLSTTLRTNDTATGSGSTFATARANRSHSAGKRYFEIKNIGGTNSWFGLADSTAGILTTFLSNAANSVGMRVNNAASTIAVNGSGWVANSTTSPGFTTNDIMQASIDFNSGKGWFGKNNTWVSGSPSLGTSATFTFPANSVLFAAYSGFTNSDIGQILTLSQDMTYTPPSGFIPWA